VSYSLISSGHFLTGLFQRSARRAYLGWL